MPAPGVLRALRAVLVILGVVVVAALTAVVGTVVHLWSPVIGGAPRPVGLLLAVALVVSADLALAVAFQRAAVMIAVTLGRVLVVLLLLGVGPGGDIALPVGWRTELWLLVATLLPAIASPLISMRAATVRLKAARARG